MGKLGCFGADKMKDVFIEIFGENVIAYITDDHGMTGQGMALVSNYSTEAEAAEAATESALAATVYFYKDTAI